MIEAPALAVSSSSGLRLSPSAAQDVPATWAAGMAREVGGGGKGGAPLPHPAAASTEHSPFYWQRLLGIDPVACR